MKSILVTIVLLTVAVTIAQAASIQVDDVFTSSKKWLGDHKLTVTGGPNGVRDDQAAFAQETIIFYGEAVGNPDHQILAQRELMAGRAAVVIAQRALVEYLAGFALVSDKLVNDGMEQIRSTVAGYIKGSQIVYQEYSAEKNKAIAFVKLGLHGPEGFASALYEKLSAEPKMKDSLQSNKPLFKVPPSKVAADYDGLIIDATEQNFRPALINRIFATRGDVLYDPVTVEKKVLVEQGCGEYANSIRKAKSALEARGVKNPLVVKAAGTATTADLLVSDMDATTIYSANLKGKFFSAAKVAFVLK